MRSRHLGEKGQILAGTAIAMVAMLALAALALDGSLAFETRRRAQTAADAAAVAAAVELKKGGSDSDAIATGRKQAKRNGFENGVNGVSVTIHNPPTSGEYAGNDDYVEAIVNETRNSMLLRALKGGFNTTTAGGRAVAGPGDGDVCILVTHPTDSRTLSMSGSASIIAPNCTVAVNSSDSRALNTSGSACIDAKAINVVGNYSGSCFTPAPDAGAAETEDPFVDLPSPSFDSTCLFTNKVISSSTPIAQRTLNPGTYCGGLTISSAPGVKFNPGLYIMKGGGFKSSGGSTTLQGTGVTFYLTGTTGFPYDAVVISGGGTVNLSAPTSGEWEAILFYQDRNIVSTKVNTISGGSTMNVEGSLYFPTTNLVYTGGSTNHGAYTVIVAYRLTLTGPSGIGSDFSGLASGSPVKTKVSLAE